MTNNFTEIIAQNGKPDNVTHDQFLKLATELGRAARLDGPDLDDYVSKLVAEAKARRNGDGEADGPGQNPYNALDDFIFGCVEADKDIPPVTHLIENFIIEGNLFLLFGQSGSNKTNFLLDALYHVASGQAFLGREVEQRNVLWVEYDTGENPMRNRVASFNRHYNFNPAINEFGVLAKMTLDAMVDLSKLASCVQFGMWLQTTGYQVLVLDALINVTGDTDMNSPAMRLVMNNLRLLLDYVPTICVIAHTNKGHRELANSENIRNQSDDIWRISAEEVGGQKTSRVALTMQKARTTEFFADIGAEFHFEKYASEDGTVSKQTRTMFFEAADPTTIDSDDKKLRFETYSLHRAKSLWEAGHQSQRKLSRAMLGKNNVPNTFRDFYNQILLPSLNDRNE